LGENENDTHTKELYEAAVRADQAVKLSIFATRPAIYAPLFNFACEAMGTTAFLFGVTLLVMQTSMLPSPVDVVYQKCILPFVLGFFIVICVVGLGGPTGFSANPARDFSPRLAHFLLPIVGKGCSEWRYAWIAFLGPYVGGAMAGGLGIAMKYLYNSGGTAYFSVPR
jgi:glycerol uptake facilitator protein